jgi:hypothetical protein
VGCLHGASEVIHGGLEDVINNGLPWAMARAAPTSKYCPVPRAQSMLSLLCSPPAPARRHGLDGAGGLSGCHGPCTDVQMLPVPLACHQQLAQLSLARAERRRRNDARRRGLPDGPRIVDGARQRMHAAMHINGLDQERAARRRPGTRPRPTQRRDQREREGERNGGAVPPPIIPFPVEPVSWPNRRHYYRRPSGQASAYVHRSIRLSDHHPIAIGASCSATTCDDRDAGPSSATPATQTPEIEEGWCGVVGPPWPRSPAHLAAGTGQSQGRAAMPAAPARAVVHRWGRASPIGFFNRPARAPPAASAVRRCALSSPPRGLLGRLPQPATTPIPCQVEIGRELEIGPGQPFCSPPLQVQVRRVPVHRQVRACNRKPGMHVRLDACKPAVPKP